MFKTTDLTVGDLVAKLHGTVLSVSDLPAKINGVQLMNVAVKDWNDGSTHNFVVPATNEYEVWE